MRFYNSRIVSITSVLVASLVITGVPTVHAAVKDGASCKKVKQLIISSGYLYECKKVKNKLVWKKGSKVTVESPSQEVDTPTPTPTPTISNIAIPNFPNTMSTSQSYQFTPKGVALDKCSSIINYPSGQTKNQDFALNNSGIISLKITLGATAGNLTIKITCDKSGTFIGSAQVGNSSVATPTVPTPTVPTPVITPTPTQPPISNTPRYKSVCIAGGPFPGDLIKAGCQESYPGWDFSFCYERRQSLAWNLYLDSYSGTQYRDFTIGQRLKSTGIDSPDLCPDPNKPLFFSVGDYIPTQVTYPSNFRGIYRVVGAYIAGGNVRRIEYTFAVYPK